MADVLKGLFGGTKSSIASVVSDDPDFADFATAASPAAPSHAASSIFSAASESASAGADALRALPLQNRPFTKWYRIWERTTIEDFYQEMFILPVIILICLVHIWGTRSNKSRAKKWADVYVPVLESEFASVGFKTGKKGSTRVEQGTEDLLKQTKKNVYTTYATGRQNVAYADVQLTLHKRYNPLGWLGETAMALFLESVPDPAEKVEATVYCFDGKEKAILPQSASIGKDSTFDGFVWAIVHKDKMKELRDERYDVSLTATRDNPKLPEWATIMSESAEVTDTMLTPELIKAVNQAGEDLESLVISDMPVDAPKKLNDLIPRKRISLSLRLPSNPSTSLPLFQYFLRIPDVLVNTAHFRPEATRKIKATREDEMRKIRKLDDTEKAEERRTAQDKMKKEERARRLEGMSAEEQKKFLEREKKDQQKKMSKKQTMRG